MIKLYIIPIISEIDSETDEQTYRYTHNIKYSKTKMLLILYTHFSAFEPVQS